MRKLPLPSVTLDRTFSMSAGLDASTVTPGSTAPDASLTTPAIDAWAYTTDGTRMHDSSTPASTLPTLRIGSIPLLSRPRRPASDTEDSQGFSQPPRPAVRIRSDKRIG